MFESFSRVLEYPSPKEYNSRWGHEHHPLPTKKWGSIVIDHLRELVEDVIMDWDLEYVKLYHGKFTLSNRRISPGYIFSRLYRFLVQHPFLSLRFIVDSSILPFSVSNHKPILLEFTKDQNIGPIPFFFSPSWIQHEGNFDLV